MEGREMTIHAEDLGEAIAADIISDDMEEEEISDVGIDMDTTEENTEKICPMKKMDRRNALPDGERD